MRFDEDSRRAWGADMRKRKQELKVRRVEWNRRLKKLREACRHLQDAIEDNDHFEWGANGQFHVDTFKKALAAVEEMSL